MSSQTSMVSQNSRLVYRTHYLAARVWYALGKIGFLSKVDLNKDAVFLILKNTLQDIDVDVREAAASALGKLLEKKPDLELLAMLRHHDSGYRIAAAHALAQKTKLAKSTLTEIKRLVKDETDPGQDAMGSFCLAFDLPASPY